MTDTESRYVETWAHDLDSIRDLDGIRWHDAPNPPPRHTCWAQTKGFVNGNMVFRCACGAIALDSPRYFMQKNANIDPHHTIYSDDYYPPEPLTMKARRWLLRFTRSRDQR